MDIIDELLGCRDVLRSGAIIVGDHSAPEFVLRKRFQVILGNNAEVDRPALECLVKLLVLLLVRVDNLAAGQDNLEVFDIVAREPDPCCVEGVAAYRSSSISTILDFSFAAALILGLTTDQETTNTHRTTTATRDRHTMRLQGLVDLLPA